MPWSLPWVTGRMSQSTAMEKSTEDRMHPCLTPASTLKCSASCLSCITWHLMLLCKAWMMLINFSGIPWRCRIFWSDRRHRLPKAFSKSMNATYKELLHSCDCSRICVSTKMWPMHDFLFLKPIVLCVIVCPLLL